MRVEIIKTNNIYGIGKKEEIIFKSDFIYLDDIYRIVHNTQLFENKAFYYFVVITDDEDKKTTLQFNSNKLLCDIK